MICWMVMPIIPCQNHSVRLSRPDNGTQDKSDLMRLVYLRIERASPDLKASTFLQSGVVHVSVSNLEIEKPTVLFQLFPFSFYDSPIPFHLRRRLIFSGVHFFLLLNVNANTSFTHTILLVTINIHTI